MTCATAASSSRWRGNTGAGGNRVATGTYTLEQLADGRTRIMFHYAWQQVPLRKGRLHRSSGRVTQTALRIAMQRLAEQLGDRRRRPETAA